MMKRSVIKLAMLCLSVFSLVSCGEGPVGGKDRSTGKINEILVITANKDAWFSGMGDSIRAVFGQPMAGVSQPEPQFDLLNFSAAHFNDVYKRFHNILIIEIGPQFDQVLSETKRDLWSSPQRIIMITSPDTASFLRELTGKKEAYMKYFTENERIRTNWLNAMAANIDLVGQVESAFGFSLDIPAGFSLVKKDVNFMWLRHAIHKEKQDIELGILIYTQDYTDTALFDPRYIILRRNLVTQMHIPGPSEDSYMTVSAEYIPPVFSWLEDFPAGYTVETRGLWKVENDFMGGPFLNYTFLDEAGNRVVTLDGYVYNPNGEKKDYLRQLEALFYSVEYSGQK
jgi:hypothetical protein